MSLESATYILDLSASNPVGGDERKQGDDHLRLIKTVLRTTFPNADKSFYFPDSAAKTANYSILAADQNKFFTVNTASAFQLTLPVLTTADDGWYCWVQKITTDTNACTIAPASGTINGLATLPLTRAYGMVMLWWSGTAWWAFRPAQFVGAAQDFSVPGDFAVAGNALIIGTLGVTGNLTGTWNWAGAGNFAGLLTANAGLTVVGTLTIPNLSVITAYINDLAITAAKIADATITRAKLAATAKPALVRIDTQTVAAAASVDFAIGLDDTYDEYLIVADLTFSADGAVPRLRVGTGGVPTYQSGAGAYRHNIFIADDGGAGSTNGSTSATYIPMCDEAVGVGNAAGEGWNAKIEFSNPEVATRMFRMRYHGAYSSFADRERSFMGSGRYNTAAAVTAVRIIPDTGTVTGKAILYGYTKD